MRTSWMFSVFLLCLFTPYLKAKSIASDKMEMIEKVIGKKVRQNVLSSDSQNHHIVQKSSNGANTPRNQSADSLSFSRPFQRIMSNLKAIVTHKHLLFFFIGIILVTLLVRMTRSRFFSFLSTLEHELTHGIVAVLSGGSLTSMTVNAEGSGSVSINNSNILVCLAPYCLPLFSTALLCTTPLLTHQTRDVAIVIAGAFYGNFVIGNFHTIGSQSDISRSGGRILAYPVIFLANATILLCLWFALKHL